MKHLIERPETPFVASMTTQQLYGTLLVKKWLPSGKALVQPIFKGMHDQGYLFDEREVDVLSIWERLPVPTWMGEAEAFSQMWDKVRAMPDKELKTVWLALYHYDPCDFWDKNSFIGMDAWAEAICSEMDMRNISHFEDDWEEAEI